MSNSKHTPGPYAIITEEVIPTALCRDYFGDVYFEIQAEEGAYTVGYANKETDARLLAAAPEMLEALKLADDLIRKARQYFPKSIHNSDKFRLETACAAIGTAITKAEGRDNGNH